MTWLDGTRWDGVKGRALTTLLIDSYSSQHDAEDLLRFLDIDRGLMPTDARTVEALWINLTRSLHEARRLRLVVDHLATSTPALAAQLSDVAADPQGQADGNPEDMYDVQILSGRRPLIDRLELRARVRQFLEERYPLLLIGGDPRAGKTYSRELLLHVTEGEPNLVVVDVDFAPVANGNSAADLINKLSRLVDVEEIVTTGDTTRQRKAIELVDQFVGRYRSSIHDTRRRLLIVDGLNRDDLQDDVQDAAAQLAVEVVKARLPRTQIVLIGWKGAIDPDIDYGCLIETATVVTATHLYSFFSDLRLPAALTPERINDLVDEAMSGPKDLRALASRVQTLTIDLLGAR